MNNTSLVARQYLQNMIICSTGGAVPHLSIMQNFLNLRGDDEPTTTKVPSIGKNKSPLFGRICANDFLGTQNLVCIWGGGAGMPNSNLGDWRQTTSRQYLSGMNWKKKKCPEWDGTPQHMSRMQNVLVGRISQKKKNLVGQHLA